MYACAHEMLTLPPPQERSRRLKVTSLVFRQLVSIVSTFASVEDLFVLPAYVELRVFNESLLSLLHVRNAPVVRQVSCAIRTIIDCSKGTSKLSAVALYLFKQCSLSRVRVCKLFKEPCHSTKVIGISPVVNIGNRHNCC